MRNRSIPTRLELHRLKFHHMGRLIPFLRIGELDIAERALISRDFFTRMHITGSTRNPYDIYAETLAEWGIMCPHPEETITYSESYAHCNCCGSSLIEWPQRGLQFVFKPR